MSSSIAKHSKLNRRPLYKAPRPPARKKGVLLYQLAPIGCPDANEGEVAKALFAMAWQAGVKIGRGSGYDPLRDIYECIGTSRATGKAQDWKIAGADIAELIRVARILNGGQMATQAQRQVRRRLASKVG